MSEDRRPNPEAILARLKREERTARRGRLRIYLGAFPGVGKTFTMLSEAHRRRGYGEDVVVGYVETHGRKGVVELLQGLEVMPRKKIEYRGVTLEEMDVEAILERHPAVCLVDELAHTNVAGSDREKRYEDVQVLLDAGIDVVTTLNVQHLESLNDSVLQLTGVRVRETIPDFVLDRADEVILIDLSPEGARARMEHGHIYPPEQAKAALQNFYRSENLAVLRDLALRRTTAEVDEQLSAYMRESAPATSIANRLLVLIDESPVARVLLRQAWQEAQGLKAEVVVAFSRHDRTEVAGKELARNLELAEDLNGRLLPIEGEASAAALLAVIDSEGVNHVLLAHEPARGMGRLLRPRLADVLLEARPDLKLHIVSVAERGTNR